MKVRELIAELKLLREDDEVLVIVSKGLSWKMYHARGTQVSQYEEEDGTTVDNVEIVAD